MNALITLITLAATIAALEAGFRLCRQFLKRWLCRPVTNRG